MFKDSKKTIISIVVAAAVFLGLYFGVKNLNEAKTVEGEKTINIVIMDKNDQEIYNESIATDTLILGDLIDEVNENEDEDLFIFDGEKDSEFGRFISEITLIELDEGEFWVYESDNNKVCLSEAFCPGVDMLAIEDGDNFSFNITKP